MASVKYPYIRKRFVASARFWKERPDFRCCLEITTEQWNAHFPELRFESAFDRNVEPWQPGAMIPLPPAFQRALDAMNRRLARDGQSIPEDMRLDAALTAWTLPLQRLSEMHWPSRLFPHWSGTLYSPAIGFVAGCLLLGPEFVEPDDWFPKQGVEPRINAYDPNEEALRPDAQYWRVRYHTFLEVVNHLVATGTALTTEHVAELDRITAERAAPLLVNAGTIAPNEPVGTLPLVPGMSTGDYRGAESHVKQLLDQVSLDETIDAAIHQLNDSGYSKREIAGRLGLDRETVVRRLA